MATTSRELPRHREDLVISQVGDDDFVIKTPIRREYYNLGQVEHFLLMKLDGSRSKSELSSEFESEFGERLSDDEIDEFLQIVRSRGLLEDPADLPAKSSSKKSSSRKSSSTQAAQPLPTDDDDDEESLSGKKQSLLFYKLPLFDPDRVFNWIEPQIRWVWTRAFAVVSASAMLLALLIVLSNGVELVASFSHAMRWETLILIGCMIILATLLHEFAHGLTCKHFGGAVHEIGVMLMFFIPCLYCNVSDAWLMREKRKRLLITAAGGYCDLCIWALCVFLWRITVPGCLLSYLAFTMMTVCGSRGFINLNPLLRLDGYYLLSDWLEMPNLRKRALDHWMAHVRWFLWGAQRPNPVPRGRLLIAYGVMCWCFAIVFLDIVLFRLMKTASDEFGVFGLTFTLLLCAFAMRRVFKGFWGGEFMTMVNSRKKRAVAWVIGIAVVLGLICVFPTKHYATGDFVVRPAKRLEINAPVTGFIRVVHVEEGQVVEPGDILFELTSADLAAQLETKQAEIRESEAMLTKLTLGARPEELSEQRFRVERAAEWVKLGRYEVEQDRVRLEQELLILDQQINQAKTELEFARKAYQQSTALYQQGALAGAELQSQRAKVAVLESRVMQAIAERRSREINGVRSSESELARREQQLADAKAQLTLLEAGNHPEEIAAEKARRERIQTELEHLKQQQQRLVIRAPMQGTIATPRLHEKVGQLVTMGTPICAIENGHETNVEISISEDDVGGIQLGQPINLKARAIPFETFHAEVERIAPSASPPDAQGQNFLVVYCSVDNEAGSLRSGMTGFGRVYRGWRTLGLVALNKGMKYLRTEFWW